MQQPHPTNTTGVPVTLTAIDPNNNFVTLGTATSDASGYYSFNLTCLLFQATILSALPLKAQEHTMDLTLKHISMSARHRQHQRQLQHHLALATTQSSYHVWSNRHNSSDNHNRRNISNANAQKDDHKNLAATKKSTLPFFSLKKQWRKE